MEAAGGKPLIPTIVLPYAVDIKVAGSLSLAVWLPTLLAGLLVLSSVKVWQHE